MMWERVSTAIIALVYYWNNIVYYIVYIILYIIQTNELNNIN